MHKTEAEGVLADLCMEIENTLINIEDITAEIEALKEVATAMGLSAQEAESMLNLGGNTLEQAYKVLEIEPTATDDEVKATYRKLALKHHPDKVATLGEDVKKAAEEKFQQINNAKEMIYKARGMK